MLLKCTLPKGQTEYELFQIKFKKFYSCIYEQAKKNYDVLNIFHKIS